MKTELTHHWLSLCSGKNLKSYLREKDLLSRQLNAHIQAIELELQKIPNQLINDGVKVGLTKALNAIKNAKP